MRKFARFWNVHFLGMDAVFALMIAAAFTIWLASVEASSTHVIQVLSEQHGSIYGTIATISATLSVFMLLTAVQMVTSTTSFQTLRNNPYFRHLWKTYTQASKFLALLAVTSIICIVVDQLIVWSAPLMAFLVFASIFRVTRAVIILDLMFRALPALIKSQTTSS